MASLDQVDDLYHIVRDDSVGAQQRVEIGQLLLVGEVAVEQKVDHFLESRFLSQVVDVIAAVEQLAFDSVDEAGLGGVEVDIFESFDYLWGHGSTFLQGTRPGYAARTF